MERIEYDPEIDPTIRKQREAEVRERELTDRIRLEIGRYVEENDLVPRWRNDDVNAYVNEDVNEDVNAYRNRYANESENAYVNEDRNRYANADVKKVEKGDKKTEKQERRKVKYEARQKRAEGRRKAVRGVLTGSILSSENLRRAWPYLLGFAVLTILYIGFTFHLQRLHLEQQKLQSQVRELELQSLHYTAAKARETRRSAVVKRLEIKHIPLKEFPHPVKTIEQK